MAYLDAKYLVQMAAAPNDEQPTCWYAFLRECRRTTIGAAAQLADAIWEVRLNAKRLAKAVQQQPPAPEAPTASSAFQEHFRS